MLKFKVRNVTKKEQLIVVVEPVEEPLVLSNVIPLGCIQYIICKLKNNINSKEACDTMCDILYDINMDDETSRNFIDFICFYFILSFIYLFPFYFYSFFILFKADNRNKFIEYGGVELLCELFEKYHSLSIFKALTYALNPRYSK